MLQIFTSFDREVIKELDAGKVIAFPTDTVYGFAIKYDDENAYKSLIKLKGRDPSKPISMMMSSTYDYSSLLVVDSKVKKVMERFLPGALTVIVKAKEDAPYQLHLGTYKIGVRISADEKLDKFLKELSYPLQVTSANRSNKETLFDSKRVIDEFKDDENLSSIILGQCKSKIATTVVDLTGDKPVLLREGEIPFNKVVEIYNS